MLSQFKAFLSRSPGPSTKPQCSPLCNHPYCICTHQAYCLKTLGEEAISLSDAPSINTLISDHFSGNGIEIDYGWDSDEGWSEVCQRCHQERCQDCHVEVFTQKTNFEDVLTFETREVWICSPCRHGRCPGWKMKIFGLCGRCGHPVCAECLLDGDEKRGLGCCECAKSAEKVEVNAEESPTAIRK